MRLLRRDARRDYRLAIVLLVPALIAAPLLWQAGRVIGGVLRGGAAPAVGVADPADLLALDRHFERNFPFRKIFLVAYNSLRYEALGVLPDSVVLGVEGWLFYRSEAVRGEQSFTDFTGRVVPSRAELEGWRRTLEERQRWLAARGITYLPVVAPNKQTIYPDMLPANLRREAGVTRLDRVMAALGPWPEGLLDLRDVLRRARAVEPAYYRTDTHWNEAGMHAAWRAISEALATRVPGLPPPLPREAFRPVAARFVGDISIMIQLPFAEQTVLLRPEAELPARCGSETGPPIFGPDRIGCGGALTDPAVSVRPDGAALPRAIVFGDSFAHPLRPLIAQSFQRVRFEPRRFDRALVEAERPDVVLHIITERSLPALFETAEAAR